MVYTMDNRVLSGLASLLRPPSAPRSSESSGNDVVNRLGLNPPTTVRSVQTHRSSSLTDEDVAFLKQVLSGKGFLRERAFGTFYAPPRAALPYHARSSSVSSTTTWSDAGLALCRITRRGSGGWK
jgi:hypothetical protein